MAAAAGAAADAALNPLPVAAGGPLPPPGSAGAGGGAASSRRFAEALVKAIGVIGASEIGDKTFFIAALMAMRHPRWTVFGGALGALAAMTVLSAALGWAAPALIPKIYTHYAATGLFFFFGGKTLYDVLLSEGGGGGGGGGSGGGGGGGGSGHHEPSELEQVEQELAEREAASGGAAAGGGGMRPRPGSRASLKDAELPYHASSSSSSPGASAAALLHAGQRALRACLSPVFLNAFTLTFLAEWGDRSQIATIGLAASQDVVGVTLGSVVGHAACTGVAVLGGRHLAAHIDERTVGLVGGLVFLAFGIHSLYEGPPE
jgi:putative Ca2+/H+ antiporter (TMEM165/GDT1 family)